MYHEYPGVGGGVEALSPPGTRSSPPPSLGKQCPIYQVQVSRTDAQAVLLGSDGRTHEIGIDDHSGSVSGTRYGSHWRLVGKKRQKQKLFIHVQIIDKK